MSQTENNQPEKKTAKPNTTAQPKNFCHIHDKAGNWDNKYQIRKNLCQHTEITTHTDGNHYCLFHLPTKDKDIAEFKLKFRERLNAVENAVADTEKLPEDEQKEAKRLINYDFRYVWFPSYVNLTNHNFIAVADFISATFTADADFSKATFTSAAYFSKATFTSAADFRSAIFTSDAYFSKAIFNEKSQIYFINTRFYSTVNFYQTEIEGYVEFEGNVFLDKNDGQEAILNFQNIRLRNPERVSFNSTRLRPNWFVNVDEARKIAFNDVEWLNTEIDIDRTGLDKELKSLEKREVSRRERSLIKACNQLADNAEANRRFEEAKLLRKNAFALDGKIKCHINDAIDPELKKDIRDEVCRNYPVVNEDGGNYFCLLHNPDKNKAELFQKEFKKLRENGQTDFRGVNFPLSVRFGNTIREELNFYYATFHKRVVFHEAIFNNADFENALFKEDSELVFEYSECRGSIDLRNSVFEGKLFLNGFGEKSFFVNKNLTQIRWELYEELSSDEKIKFENKLHSEERLGGNTLDANKQALILKDARFKNPSNINFRSVRLRPHYFVGVDASKFVFHDCDWKDANGKELNIQDEISNSSNKQLTKLCNELAINYEENRSFEESSYFRYTAIQSKRLEKGLNGWLWTLDWIYWLSSGYGERRLRAFGILILLISLFGVLYSTQLSTFESVDNSQNEIICGKNRIIGNAEGISVCHGMVHSLAVASFQRPEPKPANWLTKFLVTLETILAPLQAALLALAIRRKFMR